MKRIQLCCYQLILLLSGALLRLRGILLAVLYIQMMLQSVEPVNGEAFVMYARRNRTGEEREAAYLGGVVILFGLLVILMLLNGCYTNVAHRGERMRGRTIGWYLPPMEQVPEEEMFVPVRDDSSVTSGPGQDESSSYVSSYGFPTYAMLLSVIEAEYRYLYLHRFPKRRYLYPRRSRRYFPQ